MAEEDMYRARKARLAAELEILRAQQRLDKKLLDLLASERNRELGGYLATSVGKARSAEAAHAEETKQLKEQVQALEASLRAKDPSHQLLTTSASATAEANATSADVILAEPIQPSSPPIHHPQRHEPSEAVIFEDEVKRTINRLEVKLEALRHAAASGMTSSATSGLNSGAVSGFTTPMISRTGSWRSQPVDRNAQRLQLQAAQQQQQGRLLGSFQACPSRPHSPSQLTEESRSFNPSASGSTYDPSRPNTPQTPRSLLGRIRAAAATVASAASTPARGLLRRPGRGARPGNVPPAISATISVTSALGAPRGTGPAATAGVRAGTNAAHRLHRHATYSAGSDYNAPTGGRFAPGNSVEARIASMQKALQDSSDLLQEGREQWMLLEEEATSWKHKHEAVLARLAECALCDPFLGDAGLYAGAVGPTSFGTSGHQKGSMQAMCSALADAAEAGQARLKEAKERELAIDKLLAKFPA